MTTAVQLRRGTTAETATFTGLEGETTVDTTKTTLVVHNGSTAGGFPIAREDLANVSPTNLPTITGDATAADDKFLIYDQSALALKQITRAELNNAIEQDALANVSITGGTINGTTIGGTTAAGGSFTTLNSSGATTLNGTTIPASKTLVDTDTAQTLTNKTLSTGTAITAGTINGATIGATTASTGAFTTLAYTGTLTGGTGVINIGSGQLYKDASGNVGIGTSSPSAKLDVSGLGIFRDTTASTTRVEVAASSDVPRVEFLNSGTYTATLGYRGGSAPSLQNIFEIKTLVSAPIGFYINNTERMRITSAGNVGIGTTAPGARLHVIGNNAQGFAYSNFMTSGNSTWTVVNLTTVMGLYSGCRVRAHCNENTNVNVSYLEGIILRTSSGFVYQQVDRVTGGSSQGHITLSISGNNLVATRGSTAGNAFLSVALDIFNAAGP
jgi:hypothetical protein